MKHAQKAKTLIKLSLYLPKIKRHSLRNQKEKNEINYECV